MNAVLLIIDHAKKTVTTEWAEGGASPIHELQDRYDKRRGVDEYGELPDGVEEDPNVDWEIKGDDEAERAYQVEERVRIKRCAEAAAELRAQVCICGHTCVEHAEAVGACTVGWRDGAAKGCLCEAFAPAN